MVSALILEYIKSLQSIKDGLFTSTSSPLWGISDQEFLPNFCKSDVVFNVIVLAQFLAIVITILIPTLTGSVYVDLFLVSVFVYWVALTSILALCLCRPYLNRLTERRALLMAYLLLLCIVWLIGELALLLLSNFDVISSARPDWYGYFHAHNVIIAAIINALVLRYLVARHQLQQKARSEERARAQILRQKIRPHFLFNSMNIIASLTRSSPQKAEAAIEDMGDLFRVMLVNDEALSPIHSEIDVAKKYLKLEQLRLGKRLKVAWHIRSVPRSAKTPVLVLQLLLEHAVHNGVEQLSDTSKIDIYISIEDEDMLSIQMNSTFPIENSGYAQDQSGLENIRLRLSDQYAEQAKLKVGNIEGKFSVKIIHPAFGDK